jgi:hypothetical protein
MRELIRLLHFGTGARVQVDRLAGEIRGGLRNVAECFLRFLGMTRVELEFGERQPDSRTGSVMLPSLAESMARTDQITIAAQLVREFTVEVRECSATFTIAAPHDLRRDLDSAPPVAFALIHLQQMLQGDAVGCATPVDEFAQQLLGTIEQAGAEVVAREFEFGQRAVFGRQMRAREQVLMDTDGDVELATAAHYCAERQMCIDPRFVRRQRVDESVDREIRPVIEQVVDALKVIASEVADPAHSASRAFPAPQHEPEPDRDDQNQVQIEVFDHQAPVTSLFVRASSD